MSKISSGIVGGILVFFVAFLSAFISGSFCAPVTDSDARTVTTVIDNSGYYVSIDSSDIAMNLIATPTGATAIASDTILTKTNSPTGYKLYLSVANSETNGNRLYKDGDRASGSYISPSAGTLSTPVPLAVNTWGYTTETGATESSNFIGVPLQGSEHLLQSTSSPNEQGVEQEITYGVNANMALESGIYSNEVAYTAIAEGEAAAEGTFSVFPTSALISGGGTLTIATDLYTNMEDIGEINVTLKDLNSEYTCSNPAKLSQEYGAVSITCTLPTVDHVGLFDVILSLPKFGKTYTLKKGFLFNNQIGISTMQEMTPEICASLETPSAFEADGVTINKNVPEVILMDSRDGNYYKVRKLADGNCWMAEDLRLLLTEGEAIEISTHDGNGIMWTPTTSNELIYGQDSVRYSDVFSATTETPGHHTVWSSPDGVTQVSAGEDAYRIGAATVHSYYLGDQATSTLRDGNKVKVGVLYNFYAVTAGQVDGSVIMSPTQSICPKGWKMADGRLGGEWGALLDAYGAGTIAEGEASVEDYNAYLDKISANPIALNFSNEYSPYMGLANGWAISQWRRGINPNSGRGALAASTTRYYYHSIYNLGYDWKAFGYSLRCLATDSSDVSTGSLDANANSSESSTDSLDGDTNSSDATTDSADTTVGE